MSIDTSEPALAGALAAARQGGGRWLLLHYSPPQSTAIALHSAGDAPALPAFRDAMGGDDDVLFGYAELDGRGMVLVFLRDSVGGVRRARAIVHSRAVAALFPDYLALLTVAHASQLTDELVREKLGLDGMSAAPSMASVSASAGVMDPSTRAVPAIAKYSDGPRQDDGAEPPARPRRLSPPRMPGIEPAPDDDARPPAADSTYSALLDRSRDAPVELGPPIDAAPAAAPLASPPPASERARQASLSARLRNPFRPQPQPRAVSLNSPTPASPEPAADRPAHVHSASAGSAAPAAAAAAASGSAASLFGPGPGAASPPSPSAPRFKASSLASAFRRRKRVSAGSTPPSSSPNSPLPAEPDAPPIPPKDYPSPAAAVAAAAQHARTDSTDSYVPYRPPPGIVQTSSGGIGYTPPRDRRGARRASVEADDDDDGDGGSDDDVPLRAKPKSGAAPAGLQPSASASEALARARQKSVSAENEMHEKYRRGQEARAERAARAARLDSAGGVAGAVEAGDDYALGLADGEGAGEGGDAPAPAHFGQWADAGGADDDDDAGLPYDRAPAPTLGTPGGVADGHFMDAPRGADALGQATSLRGIAGVVEAASAIVPGLEHEAVFGGGANGVNGANGDEKGVANGDAPNAHGDAPNAHGDASNAHGDAFVEREAASPAEPSDEYATAAASPAPGEPTEHATRNTDDACPVPPSEPGAPTEPDVSAVAVGLEAVAVSPPAHDGSALDEPTPATLAPDTSVRAEPAPTELAPSASASAEHEQAAPASAAPSPAPAAAPATPPAPPPTDAERLAAARAQHEAAQAELAQLAADSDARARRADDERAAAERAKRDEIRRDLSARRDGSGVMLQGWVTVQTLRSLTWRRRWFRLHPAELLLFKADHDSKPITTVPLAGAVLSEHYEESQVKGSFKLTVGDEDYYMFADSAEDKETVLVGLGLCV